MECASCKWMEDIEDSYGRMVYICVNAQSPCYLEETDVCGFCDAEEDEDE